MQKEYAFIFCCWIQIIWESTAMVSCLETLEPRLHRYGIGHGPIKAPENGKGPSSGEASAGEC